MTISEPSGDILILVWIIFIISAAPMLILAGVFLRSKGGMLPLEMKNVYDERRLLTFIGWGLILTAACSLLIPVGLSFGKIWLIWTGITLLIAIPVLMAIYCNTGNRFRI